MPEIAVIGGSGLENLLLGSRSLRVGTPYGPIPNISIGRVGEEDIAFLPRHGPNHGTPPHKINYKANLYALKQLGVKRIIATNAVGGINPSYNPGELAIPEDIVDMTKTRSNTFYDEAPVTHIDVSQPYCPELRKVLIESSNHLKVKSWGNAVLAATEGPRYETRAEIRMLRMMGCDIVGMTGAPEIFLARELEICYSALCFISNRAAGLQERLSASEVMDVGKRLTPVILEVLRKAIDLVPKERRCQCSKGIEGARA